MRRKYVAFTLGVVMTGMLFTGCNSTKDTSDTAEIASSKDVAQSSNPDAASDGKSMPNEENTVFGKITKVNGNEITYEVMERSAKDDMPRGSGAPEESKANNDDSQKPQGTPTAKPEGSSAPDGEHRGGFSSTGEKQTITVSEDTSIKIVQMKRDAENTATDGSVSDLKKDTMIQIQYTDATKKK